MARSLAASFPRRTKWAQCPPEPVAQWLARPRVKPAPPRACPIARWVRDPHGRRTCTAQLRTRERLSAPLQDALRRIPPRRHGDSTRARQRVSRWQVAPSRLAKPRSCRRHRHRSAPRTAAQRTAATCSRERARPSGCACHDACPTNPPVTTGASADTEDDSARQASDSAGHSTPTASFRKSQASSRTARQLR